MAGITPADDTVQTAEGAPHLIDELDPLSGLVADAVVPASAHNDCGDAVSVNLDVVPDETYVRVGDE